MTEYILEVFYTNQHGRRFKLSEESWNRLAKMTSPKVVAEFTEINFISDSNGNKMCVDLFTDNGVNSWRLWRREVSNPLNTPEIYDDPTN
jgi:hypothetical protein